jgi:AraC-like DNA-binding protein
MKPNQNHKTDDRAGNFPGRTMTLLPAQLPPHAQRFDPLMADSENNAAQKIERSIAYMVQHINRPLQVATLAAEARVSPSHFFALFKQRIGCPPMDYFTRLRMRHACRLLDTTSASVKEAAAALGYDDPFYFSRVFKSVNKVAPSVYRRRLREGRGELNPAGLRPGLPATVCISLPERETFHHQSAGGKTRRLPREKFL